MMIDITLIMAYYINRDMLNIHYAELAALSPELKQHISLIVVDDGSPTNPASPPRSDIGIRSLEIYRMGVDIPWNQDACRNLAVSKANTDWVLLTDMDHLIPAISWQQIFNADLDLSAAYRFLRVSMPELLPYKPHPNSYLMAKKTFEQTGGYDERYAGYYGTDGVFHRRVVEVVKGKLLQLPISLVRYPREVVSDASTSTLTRKSERNTANIYRIREEIGRLPPEEQAPKTLTFPYHKVWPKTPESAV